MNKRTVKDVERRILRSMMRDEKALRELLDIATGETPYAQLDGLMIKIEQLLGKVVSNQNKIMLLQELV
jgi:hypothetical protein